MKKSLPVLTSGAAMALAAAGLLAGCESTPSGQAAETVAKTDLIHCYGVNACAGHNACATDKNACAGHASCKGTGFVAMPSKACADIGGQQKDSFQSTISKADLSHCFGVNACAGHNDCKTAKNACAGHASCKGTGFVAMPAKACNDVGGKTG